MFISFCFSFSYDPSLGLRCCSILKHSLFCRGWIPAVTFQVNSRWLLVGGRHHDHRGLRWHVVCENLFFSINNEHTIRIWDIGSSFNLSVLHLHLTLFLNIPCFLNNFLCFLKLIRLTNIADQIEVSLHN